ncbi:MAG: transcription antitermination factor NusB [Prevotella sp.]|nr:transcription antitermination factor NusB [Prevotella sp.]MBQ8115161.1 transcription antitermination factor NusB [Prevotella sp.]MBR4268494.1 transcription antitermination factor NusB [Prevotella sp.]
MINRDIIRRKAVQLTYAYFQNGYHNIENAEKEFLFSLSKAYHLYNTLLLLVVAVTKMARKRYDVAAARADREGQERPSDRFAFNKFATQLEENTMLRTFVEEQRNVWDDKVEFVKNLFLRIEESEMYQEFMASDDDSYDAHRELWRKIYKYFVEDNEDLSALLEEESLYWNDDKEIVDSFVLKTIKRFDEKNGKNQELLPEYTDVEDREYARRLFRAAIMNSDQYQRYMTEASRNWDFSRLAYMDVVIMQLAIAEMLTFPAIPVSVTLNEYVELAKEYSTGRSAGYINGMLDTIARHLINTNKMHKTMPEKKQVK